MPVYTVVVQDTWTVRASSEGEAINAFTDGQLENCEIIEVIEEYDE